MYPIFKLSWQIGLRFSPCGRPFIYTPPLYIISKIFIKINYAGRQSAKTAKNSRASIKNFCSLEAKNFSRFIYFFSRDGYRFVFSKNTIFPGAERTEQAIRTAWAALYYYSLPLYNTIFFYKCQLRIFQGGPLWKNAREKAKILVDSFGKIAGMDKFS